MTTPSPAERRRPPLLMLVALAWLAAAALAVGGTFAPLFVATQTRTETATDGDVGNVDESMEMTGWHEHIRNGDDGALPSEVRSPQFGIPIVVGAVVLGGAGLLGFGAAMRGSGVAWRWSAGTAGAGSAMLAGAVGVVAVAVKAYGEQLEQVAGFSSTVEMDAGAGAGMWLLACGAALGVVAVVAGLIGRAYLGPDLLRPVPPEDREPPTPSFGVPVIRPVGYD